MRRIAAVSVVMASLATVSAQAPPSARISLIWSETSVDVWDELRQVDAAFKALPDEVARLAKGLEAEEIEERSKAAKSLMDLGLTAYEPIKTLRDKTASPALQTELASVLKAMAGNLDPLPARIPAARMIGETEGRDLKARLKEKKLIHQTPLMSLQDGQRGNVQVGDAHPTVAKRRAFTIEGNGRVVRQDENVSLMEVGWLMEVTPKVNAAKGTVQLDVVVTVRGKAGAVPTESILRMSPEIKNKEGFLAGPIPLVNDKGEPWWIYVDCMILP